MGPAPRRAPATPAHRSTRLLVCSTLLVPTAAVAQNPQPRSATITDSARAVATACAVVLALRTPPEPYRCQVEDYRETATEYVVRLRERPLPGADPAEFARSEVRLSKNEPSVTVTRAPEL